MGSRRTGKRAWRGPLVALGVAALLGLAVAPAAEAADAPGDPAATAILIVLGVERPEAGTPFDVIVTVQAVPPATGTPQGTVEVTLDGQPVASATLNAAGSATVMAEVDDQGSHELEAQYQGDADFAASSAQSVFTADPLDDSDSGVPSRPQLPRGADPPSAPSSAPPAASPLPTAAPVAAPSDLAFTGAFALPGLLIGLSSIGVGLGCRRFARGAQPD